ncbi:transketolase family protein [Rickettsia endosymbiont of Cardiosporidium cionae]|uniref:transketolase family protein n=1 Tax=Rickettsia endosymbiont of Cardiosporidium cionae TaxID=2777155 RepID=UPI0018956C77|nr:transketolase [Rickettsia endosymbiont of Cardiosporidium cionae]KAF8818361.1 palindromic element RPE2 domain-containing protein [Rickettsia endosymbiont of Cardiosporidium cionae]
MNYHELANAIRILSIDAIESAQSGHPGMPLGFADVMTNLAFNFLRFNPNDPTWFNRDRIVLSAGHGSMLLYSFYYLAGYKDFTLDDIKKFRQLYSKTAGHPEYDKYQAIETTTGPLGQGLANAVGMAIAQKKHQVNLGHDICNYRVYVVVGDGCLMEGIAYEAASLAGHLKLDNLIILFDNNSISIDGATSLTVSEDHLKKFDALGFSINAVDGYNHLAISSAMNSAISSDKPSFISFETIIGKGTQYKSGTSDSHGSALGTTEIEFFKNNIDVINKDFYLPECILQYWRESWERNICEYNLWYKNIAFLGDNKKYFLLKNRIKFCKDKVILSNHDESTRASSGKVIEQIMLCDDGRLIIGSADLSVSTHVFHPKLSKVISKDDFGGNFLHYGTREHAMSAIINGLVLSGINAIASSFLVFSDYMRPAIRLSSIMKLPTLYIMTHDSIGVGEDGPTHQPIEQLASLRAMPNLLVLRPADLVETIECYDIISNYVEDSPLVLVLTRQKLPQIRSSLLDINLSMKGGYVISEAFSQEQIDITIFATGSEVHIATNIQKIMFDIYKISVRVVSVVSFELLNLQPKKYLEDLVGNSILQVGIEAATSFGWHKIIGKNGYFFGIEDFGISAPGKQIFEYFNLTSNYIAKRLVEILKSKNSY